MKFKSREKRFLRQLLYYFNRRYSEMNSPNLDPLAGFSFDSILHHINIFGTYEKYELEAVRRFLKSRTKDFGLALDVGANIGNHTSRFLSAEFEKIYCYEPNPKVFSLLKLNMEAYKNVTCFNFGLSDETACLPFSVNRTNWGASRVIEQNQSDFEIINVRPLDDEDLDTRVSLIKLDIEGHEFRFLNGARKTIMKDKPIILFEENEVSLDGYSPTILLIKDMGYDFFTIEENFYFGDSKLSKLTQYFLQDLFGISMKIAKADDFRNKIYNMIIAVPAP